MMMRIFKFSSSRYWHYSPFSTLDQYRPGAAS